MLDLALHSHRFSALGLFGQKQMTFDVMSRFERLGRAFRQFCNPAPALPTITLIGNPFEAIGRSDLMRSIWRALNAASVRSFVYDAFGGVPEADVLTEMGHCCITEIADGIRIFHLNGEEIKNALKCIEGRQGPFLSKGYNIVAPAWELTRYPTEWARELVRFDEVWAPSTFVEEAIRRAVSIPVFRIVDACEPYISVHLGRSHFGIPDGFAILYYFDVRSYITRKNPWAVIEAVRRVIAMRPAAKVHLVLKLNYSSFDPCIVSKIKERITGFRENVTIIDTTLTNNETKNLVRCCDCFLSLHRSEGFGRGPAEAMFLGKPVIATGWSGNMEYMNDSVAFPINYRLESVKEGEYPHHEDQVWADPDIAQAVDCLIRIIDDPKLARAIGRRAHRHMRRHFSNTVLGLTYRRRLQAIASSGRVPTRAA